MEIEKLDGKEVLLTGAATGIGPHIARLLAGSGARLVLSGRNRPALDALAEELAGSRIVVADLNQREEIERLAEEAGPVDVLVSNAGLPASGRLTGFSLEEIDNALRVNLRAGIMLARLLLPAMVERRAGQLVFMASMAAHVPGPGRRRRPEGHPAKPAGDPGGARRGGRRGEAGDPAARGGRTSLPKGRRAPRPCRREAETQAVAEYNRRNQKR